MIDVPAIKAVFEKYNDFLVKLARRSNNCNVHPALHDYCIHQGEIDRYLDFFQHEFIEKYVVEGEEPVYSCLAHLFHDGEEQNYCLLLTTTSLYLVRENSKSNIANEEYDRFVIDWSNLDSVSVTANYITLHYTIENESNTFDLGWEALVSDNNVIYPGQWSSLFNEIIEKTQKSITSENNNHMKDNLKNIEYVIGIDFGHGETSAAFCPMQWDTDVQLLDPVKDLDMGRNRKVLPSAITILDNGAAYIGDAAFAPEILKQAHVHVCFKKRPHDIDGEDEKLMIRFMQEVYNRIRQDNPGTFTDNNHLVYIATPSGWNKEEQELYGQMARKAGLPLGGVTKESRAAFVRAQHDVASGLGRNIENGAIVFDMGSSTLDFTYMNKNLPNLIDNGYECGASAIEKAIFKEIEQKEEVVQLFEKKYPDLVDFLLFEARKVKEEYYMKESANAGKEDVIPLRVKKTILFEDYIEDEKFEDEKVKFSLQPESLTSLLMQNGYLNEIREAMLSYREESIPGQKIYGVFMTGGASRMEFLKDLICDCWGVSRNQIFRDQDPSLTISDGVAEVARMDLRTEGMDEGLEEAINRLIDGTIIYNDFIESFTQALYDVAIGDIANTVISFKDATENYSINDLQTSISNNVNEDIKEISGQASQYVEAAIAKNTQDIRTKVEGIVAHYTSEGIQVVVPTIKVPSINVTGININSILNGVVNQIVDNSGISWGGLAGGAAAGAAIGSVIPIIGTITGALIGGAIGAFSEDESDKKRKARESDLDQSKRLQVYNYVDSNWENIQNQVKKAVRKSVLSNKAVQENIRSVTSELLKTFKENLKSARLLID